MTAIPDRDVVADAQLATAAAAGDRDAFAGIYDRYADRLHDFSIGMLRDPDAAADCVQDTFCLAATRLPQLRDPDRLRPWLYAIARNEALRRIRDRTREQPSEDLPEVVSGEPGPDTVVARTELADLIAEAAGGLSDRDREVLELAYRHGLDGPELAEALGVTPATARTLTHRMRETIERSLGALLLARGARDGRGCPDLVAMLNEWDGQFSVLIRKRIARHIDSCANCEEERRRRVSPVALLGAAPFLIPAPHGLRDRTLGRIQLTCADTAIADARSGDSRIALGSAGHPQPAAGGSHHRRRALLVVLGAIAVTAAAGTGLVWVSARHVPVSPISSTTMPSASLPSEPASSPPASPAASTTPTSPSTIEPSPPPLSTEGIAPPSTWAATSTQAPSIPSTVSTSTVSTTSGVTTTEVPTTAPSVTKSATATPTTAPIHHGPKPAPPFRHSI